MRLISRSLLAGLLAVWFFTGCEPRVDLPETALPHEHRFAIGLGGETVHLQFALTPRESASGLMHRESLEPNEGMLFIFPEPRQASFWMKNTPLPLDIGFFDAEGLLLEVRQLHPFDETLVNSHGDNVLIAVEMARGWFRENRVRPGARLDLDAVREAIQARGFDPAGYPFRD